jgi:hypothetical protein
MFLQVKTISAPSSIPGSSTTEGPQISGPSSLGRQAHINTQNFGPEAIAAP